MVIDNLRDILLIKISSGSATMLPLGCYLTQDFIESNRNRWMSSLLERKNLDWRSVELAYDSFNSSQCFTKPVDLVHGVVMDWANPQHTAAVLQSQALGDR